MQRSVFMREVVARGRPRVNEQRLSDGRTIKVQKNCRRRSAMHLGMISRRLPTVILRYSEGSAQCWEPARSFGVPQDDGRVGIVRWFLRTRAHLTKAKPEMRNYSR